jgi:hypothetical protein
MQPFKSLRSAVMAFFLLPAIASHAQLSFPYDAVNPIIGTDGGGNTFPGATLPFGMIQWSPDTNTDAWYYHHDKQITGFSLTHVSGAGCPLYGDFAVLPTTGEFSTSPGTGIAPYAAAFDHSKEEAHPGYYAIARQRHPRRNHSSRALRHCPLHLSRWHAGTPAGQRRLKRQHQRRQASRKQRLRQPDRTRLRRVLRRAPSPPAVSAPPTRITSSTSPASSTSLTSPQRSGKTTPSSPTPNQRKASTPARGSTSAASTKSSSRSASPSSARKAPQPIFRKEIPGFDFDDIHDRSAPDLEPDARPRRRRRRNSRSAHHLLYRPLPLPALAQPLQRSRTATTPASTARCIRSPDRSRKRAVRQLLRLGHLPQHRPAPGPARFGALVRHDAVARQRCPAERLVSALARRQRRHLRDGRRFARSRHRLGLRIWSAQLRHRNGAPIHDEGRHATRRGTAPQLRAAVPCRISQARLQPQRQGRNLRLAHARIFQ